MKTIKGNKKNVKKEYENFCKDFNFIKKYTLSKEYFAKCFIENEIIANGLFYNKNFKTLELEKIQNEIISIL